MIMMIMITKTIQISYDWIIWLELASAVPLTWTWASNPNFPLWHRWLRNRTYERMFPWTPRGPATPTFQSPGMSWISSESHAFNYFPVTPLSSHWNHLQMIGMNSIRLPFNWSTLDRIDSFELEWIKLEWIRIILKWITEIRVYTQTPSFHP